MPLNIVFTCCCQRFQFISYYYNIPNQFQFIKYYILIRSYVFGNVINYDLKE